MRKHIDYYKSIFEAAETLIQTRGYNAFSYRNLAAIVGIKTSSIHYYFPTKADLGKAVVKKHIDLLCDELELLLSDKNFTYLKKVEIFIESIIEKTYRSDQKMCLGGMLASDVLTLPHAIQYEVRDFFNRLEGWLTNLLLEAIKQKEIKMELKEAKNKAMLVLAIIEGSLLLARLFQHEENLAIAKQHILSILTKS